MKVIVDAIPSVARRTGFPLSYSVTILYGHVHYRLGEGEVFRLVGGGV
ncbi:MAG TPA: hypothetical protein VEI80_02720 [Candidatus Acidoferrales bacterium]|nr:hypothetical protein [Candidatus Acidoferrales bacterium]